MTTFIKDAVCGSHSMRKAFAVVSAEIREKLVAALSHEVAVCSSFVRRILFTFSRFLGGNFGRVRRRNGVRRLAPDDH